MPFRFMDKFNRNTLPTAIFRGASHAPEHSRFMAGDLCHKLIVSIRVATLSMRIATLSILDSGEVWEDRAIHH